MVRFVIRILRRLVSLAQGPLRREFPPTVIASLRTAVVLTNRALNYR
jgi:hypothetical protein